MKQNLLLFFLLSAFISSAQWNKEVSQNLNTTESIGVGYNFQSVKAKDGKTWIAFYRKTPRKESFNMYVQLLNVDGQRMLGNGGVLISDLPSGSFTEQFYVGTDSTNNLIVAFQYLQEGISKAVIFKVDETGKKLWGKNGITLGTGIAPFPAILSTGETAVVWAASDDVLKMSKISTDGKLVWDTAVQLRIGNSGLTQGQIVPNRNGQFTVIMQQRLSGPYSFLYAMRYDVNGKSLWPQPVKLNSTSTQSYYTFSPVADKDTTYLGYFYVNFSQIKICFLQRINPDGKLPYGINGSNFSIDTVSNLQNYVSINSNPDLPYVWAVCSISNIDQSKYGIKVQKYLKSNGKRLLGDKGEEIFPLAENGETHINPVAVTDKGNLIFAHHDANHKIYATNITPKGKFGWIKHSIELSTTAALSAESKGGEIFNHSNGEGVVTWAEQRDSDYSIYAQNITNDGATGIVVLATSGIELNSQFANNKVELNWKTLSEKNNRGFVVERSDNGSIFKPLSFVPSRATTASSDENFSYRFIDSSFISTKVYYRIKQTDNDNKLTYSNVIYIANVGLSINTLTVFPNPVKDILTAKITSQRAFQGRLSVTDISGRLLLVKKVQVIRGEMNEQIDVSNFSFGTYFLELMSEDGKFNIEKTFVR